MEKVFFYVEQYPVPLRWTAQIALLFTPSRPFHSSTNMSTPGSILAIHQLRATTKSLTCPPLSIARYSFIQLSDLGRRGENKNAETSKRQKSEIQTRALSLASPAFYSSTTYWVSIYYTHIIYLLYPKHPNNMITRRTCNSALFWHVFMFAFMITAKSYSYNYIT